MKKLFTIAAALLASFSLWAQEADIAIDAMTAEDATTYFKEYDGTNVLYAGDYQLTGEYYNIKADQTNNSAYVGITSDKELAKVAFLVTGNGSNKNINAGLIGYTEVAATPDFANADYATNVDPAVTIANKNYTDAEWVEFDLSGLELKAVYFSKQWKNVVIGTAAKASFPSGNAQSLFVYGIRVWFAGGSSSDCIEADAEFDADETDLAIEEGEEEVSTNLTFTAGDNTSTEAYTVLKDGKATTDAVVENGVFTATAAGEYTVKASQAADDTYCQVVKEVVITVTDNRPAPTEMFSLVCTASSDVTISNGGTQQEIAPDYGTVTGGSAYMQNDHGSKSQKVIVKSGHLSFGAGTITLVMELDEPLNEGDIITATGLNSEGLCFGVTFSRSDNLDNQLASEEDSFEVPADFEGATTLYAWRHSSNGTNVKSINIVRPADDGTAKLVVNADDIDLDVTPEVANPSAKVVFSGKNLTPGTYDLVVPNVAGLSVNPAAVTVGEDGKLNAEVTISYASSVDVEAAIAEVELTIDELDATVTINYSAAHAVVYSTSVDFENYILTNGLGAKHDDAVALLEAANIEYANINELDSLNDEKAARNEPFLGMKIKTAGGYIKVCLEAGKTLKVKFGNLPAAVKVTINGEAQPDHSEGDFELEAAAEDRFVTLATSTGGTVVFKQIMIGEDFAEVVLPESPVPSALENAEGEVKAAKRVVNGQLVIEREGVRYNAQGAVLK